VEGDPAGGAGGHHHPDVTPLYSPVTVAGAARYGFEAHFRVLDGETVRRWLRGIRTPAS
jgi:hypothetical protein